MKTRLALALLAIASALGAFWYVKTIRTGRADQPDGPTEHARRSGEAEQARQLLQALMAAPLSDRTSARAGTLGLRGRAISASGPASGAIIVATPSTSPTGAELLSEKPCRCDGTCGQKLLRCGCGEVAHQLVALLAQREPPSGDGRSGLESAPVARAVADEQGRFVLEGLEAGRYTLWAEHPTAGLAIQEGLRAGDQEVELALARGIYLRGRVVETDERPLAGARVSAILVAGSRVFETTADAQGRFSFGPLPAAEYRLLAAHEGFLPEDLRVDEEPEPTLELKLQRPRRLGGVVLSRGRPVEGVQVTCETHHKKLVLRTDASGAFEATGLRSGSYELTAVSGGEIAQSTVRLAEDEDETDLVLELAASAVVEGVVADTTGAPVREATVYARGEEGSAERVTDGRGRFRFELPAGEYHFRARAKGFRDDSKGAGVDGRQLVPGVQSVRLVLARGQSLTGTVIDANGAPVAEAKLRAAPVAAGAQESRHRRPHPAESRPSARATSDETGAFELSALGEGDYELTAVHPSFKTLTSQVRLPSGPVSLKLERGSSVSGRVLDESGVPLPAAEVAIVPDVPVTLGEDLPGLDAQVRHTKTNAAGEFKLEGVGVGRYVAMAHFQSPGSLSGARTVSKKVELTGAPLRLELQLVKGLSISGRAVDRRGSSVPGVRLRAERDASGDVERTLDVTSLVDRATSGEAVSGEDGRFVLDNLKPGRFLISGAGETHVFAEPRPVMAETGARDVVVTMARIAQVRGRVVDRAGRPVERFELDGETIRSTAGEYAREIRHAGELRLRFDARGFAPEERTLRVELEQEQHLPDVVLTPGRSVRVTVNDATTGAPLSDASVDVDLRARTGPRPRHATPRTNEAGMVVLAGVSDALAQVEVQKKGYVTQRILLQPGSGALTVPLEPGGSIVGRVVDASGHPVESGWYAIDNQAGIEARGPLGADGTFVAAELAPGRYRVSAAGASSNAPFEQRWVDVPIRGSVSVELRERPPGTDLQVRVLNPSGIEVFAQAALLPGQPSLPGSIEAWRRLRVESLPVSLEDGRALFRSLEPGQYTLFIAQPEPGRAPGTRALGLHSVAVDIGSPGSRSLDVRLPPALHALPLPDDADEAFHPGW